MNKFKIQNFIILILFVFPLLFSLNVSKTKAYFSASQTYTSGVLTIHIEDNSSPSTIVTVEVEEEIFDEYMELNENGEYEWKTDEYGNIENREEIKDLTYEGAIVHSDTYYEVISPSYNFIDHGLPSKDNPLSWAIRPMVIDYIEGWAYLKNRVVKTENDEYFMARYYTTANPSVNRTGWDKIEPVEDTDFNFYEGTSVPNYAEPILSNIERAYIWDNYTTYQVGDVVMYNGIEYRAKRSSSNQRPNTASWAWEQI